MKEESTAKTGSKMIDVSRTVKKRDYRNEKDGERIYKTEKVLPSLTIVGVPALGQMKYNEDTIVKVKLRSTGFSERHDWDSENNDKITECTFDILEMEVPDEAMPVKVKNKVKSDSYDPIASIGDDDAPGPEGDDDEND